MPSQKHRAPTTDVATNSVPESALSGPSPDNSFMMEQLASEVGSEPGATESSLLTGFEGDGPGHDIGRVVGGDETSDQELDLAAPPTVLTNRRFLGDPDLEAAIAGTATISSGDNGAGVSKIQAALEDLGYPLPKYGADGDFGSESSSAVTSFQTSEGLAVPSPGAVGQLTMLRLDQRAPQATGDQYAWREQEIDSDGPSAPQTTLSNTRFVGDPMLSMLMTGVGAMARGTEGPHVWKVQAALRDMGFDLGNAGADGDYGGATAGAVAAFQDAYNVPFEPATGITYTEEATERGAVNGVTMALLDAYAPAAAPVDTAPAELSAGHSPDYAALFADGRFDLTLAIGYDDNSNAHRRKRDQAIGYLSNEMGFSMTDPRTASDTEITAAGLTPGDLHREMLYFTKTIHSATTGSDVQVTVKLLCAEHDGKDGAARRDLFREGMEDDDAVLYTGHARAGTGPDFDPHASSEGNYVMGDGYNDHYNEEIDGAENQLDQTEFDDHYQVYQMWGCTTENYWQHIRPRLRERGEDGERLESHKDIVTTNQSIPTARGLWGTLAFLQGMLAEANSNTLTDMTNSAMRMNVTVTHGM